jgi:Pyruvate/2-oxoacid:ferredoxin oxidoreductase delta subunit
MQPSITQADGGQCDRSLTLKTAAIRIEDSKVVGMDLNYCKGCGVCAYECLGKKGNKAITMEEEAKFLLE